MTSCLSRAMMSVPSARCCAISFSSRSRSACAAMNSYSCAKCLADLDAHLVLDYTATGSHQLAVGVTVDHTRHDLIIKAGTFASRWGADARHQAVSRGGGMQVHRGVKQGSHMV